MIASVSDALIVGCIMVVAVVLGELLDFGEDDDD